MPWFERARVLLEKAKHDRVVVEKAENDADFAEDIVGFHVQQTAEK